MTFNFKLKISSIEFKKYLTLFICGATTLISVTILLPFITPAFRKICLPYVPATNEQLKRIKYLLYKHGIPNKSLIDLGSGDGRVIFAIGQDNQLNFPQLNGIEINRPLVWYSRYLSYKLNVPATFIRKDIWKYKLNSYSNVIIFGVDTMMNDLEQKLSKELSANSCVIACRYPFPNWVPVDQILAGHESVWCYLKT